MYERRELDKEEKAFLAGAPFSPYIKEKITQVWEDEVSMWPDKKAEKISAVYLIVEIAILSMLKFGFLENRFLNFIAQFIVFSGVAISSWGMSLGGLQLIETAKNGARKDVFSHLAILRSCNLLNSFFLQAIKDLLWLLYIFLCLLNGYYISFAVLFATDAWIKFSVYILKRRIKQEIADIDRIRARGNLN